MKSSMTERIPHQVPESGVWPVTTNSTSSDIVRYGLTGSPLSAARRSAKNCLTTATQASVSSGVARFGPGEFSDIADEAAGIERKLDQARVRKQQDLLDAPVAHTEHAATESTVRVEGFARAIAPADS